MQASVLLPGYYQAITRLLPGYYQAITRLGLTQHYATPEEFTQDAHQQCRD